MSITSLLNRGVQTGVGAASIPLKIAGSIVGRLRGGEPEGSREPTLETASPRRSPARAAAAPKAAAKAAGTPAGAPKRQVPPPPAKDRTSGGTRGEAAGAPDTAMKTRRISNPKAAKKVRARQKAST